MDRDTHAREADALHTLGTGASSTALAFLNAPNARLPAVYERACLAMSECSRLDECQGWADKAECLSSYARQSNDDSLRKMADRIQARAIRRCGELLKQIEPATGAHRKSDGADTLSRKQAATDAGLSERQKVTALRVATVPKPEFDRQVESDAPPTVTQLAEQGRQTKPKADDAPAVDLEGIPPHLYGAATEAGALLKALADFGGRNDPVQIGLGFKTHERIAMRKHVAVIDRWLDVFVTNLKE
jgi:hypothetical protein